MFIQSMIAALDNLSISIGENGEYLSIALKHE